MPSSKTSLDQSLARQGDMVGKRLTISAAVLWLASGALRTLQLVTTIVLARILRPDDYGVVALAATVVGLIDVISNVQIGSALVRREKLDASHLHTAFTINLIRGLLCGGVLIVSAYPTAGAMNDPRLVLVLCALAIPTVLNSLSNPYLIALARNLDFAPESIRKTVAAIFGSIAGIVFAVIFKNYWALIFGTVCTSAATIALSYFRLPNGAGFSLAHKKELLSFGGWIVAINVLDYINAKFDYVLIGKKLGPSTLGAYHVGQQISTMATGDIVNPISNSLLSAFSIVAQDAQKLRDAYRDVQATIFSIALPIGFGVSMLSREVVYILAGPKWDLAIPVILYLAPMIALQSVTASVEALALSLNKGRYLFNRTLTFLFVRCALMMVGYMMGGFLGIIYARILSGSFLLIYSLHMAARLTDSKTFTPLLASWRSIVSVILMCLSILMLPPTPFEHTKLMIAVFTLAKVLLGGMVYVAIHLILWNVAGRPRGAERRLIDQGMRMARLAIDKLTRGGRERGKLWGF